MKTTLILGKQKEKILDCKSEWHTTVFCVGHMKVKSSDQKILG